MKRNIKLINIAISMPYIRSYEWVQTYECENAQWVRHIQYTHFERYIKFLRRKRCSGGAAGSNRPLYNTVGKCHWSRTRVTWTAMMGVKYITNPSYNPIWMYIRLIQWWPIAIQHASQATLYGSSSSSGSTIAHQRETTDKDGRWIDHDDCVPPLKILAE